VWLSNSNQPEVKMMIVVKGSGQDTILGTNGERAIIEGLKLLQQLGTREQANEAIHLLQLLGLPSHQPRTFDEANW